VANIFFGSDFENGLIKNYWSVPVQSFVIDKQTELIVKMSKSEVINLSSKETPCLPVVPTSHERGKCLKNLLISQLLTIVKEQNITLCWIPHADWFIRQMNDTQINACSTKKDMLMMLNATKTTMALIEINNNSCIKSCTLESLQIHEIHGLIPPTYKNISTLQFVWESLKVSISEEILIMDFFMFVSNVGGTLGLFLGFSFFDFALRLILKVEKIKI